MLLLDLRGVWETQQRGLNHETGLSRNNARSVALEPGVPLRVDQERKEEAPELLRHQIGSDLGG